MQLAAAEVGVQQPRFEEVREVVGLGLREAFSALYPGVAESLVEALRESYSRYFVEKDASPSPFYDGVESVLARLKDDGYLLAIATGKSRRGLDRVLKAIGYRDFFHASRCADETRSKPDPQMLVELLDHFDLPHSQAILVGDTEFDMAMARQIEMARIGVSYGAHALNRLEKYGLHSSADHMFEVEQAIRRWAGD